MRLARSTVGDRLPHFRYTSKRNRGRPTKERAIDYHYRYVWRYISL